MNPDEACDVPSAAAIERWIRDRISQLFEIRLDEINLHKPIATYGVDSVEAAALAEELEAWLGRPVPPDLVWEWASTLEISQRLAALCAGEALPGDAARAAGAD